MTKTEFIYLSSAYNRQLEIMLNNLTKYTQISNTVQISQLSTIIGTLSDIIECIDKILNNNYLATLRYVFPKLSHNLQDDINSTMLAVKSLNNTTELLKEIALDIEYAYNITHNDEYVLFSLGYTMNSLAQYNAEFNNSISKIQTLISNNNKFIEILRR